MTYEVQAFLFGMAVMSFIMVWLMNIGKHKCRACGANEMSWAGHKHPKMEAER
jgi:hypothetical protein